MTMRTKFSFGVFALSLCISAQTTDSDFALLAKTRALYDTPFLRGLINFDCAVHFDLEQHLLENFGKVPPAGSPLVRSLQGVSYRILVDHSSAVISVQGKSPDVSNVAQAANVEETNPQILQSGLVNWIPYAYGEVLPVGPTKAHFQSVSNGYSITMNGPGVSGILTLDQHFHLTSGTVKTPEQRIEITTEFIDGPDGLLVQDSTSDTDDSGINEFQYTYQQVDGFQLPALIMVRSHQGLHWHYGLDDCKTQHGIVVEVAPPHP